jgi:hypothetical protein
MRLFSDHESRATTLRLSDPPALYREFPELERKNTEVDISWNVGVLKLQEAAADEIEDESWNFQTPIKTLPLSLSLVNLQSYSCRKLLQMSLKMNPGTSKPPIKSTLKALPKSKLLQFLLNFFRGQQETNKSIQV